LATSLYAQSGAGQAAPVAGQAPDAARAGGKARPKPSNVSCKIWDDAYLTIFHNSFAGVFAGAVLLPFFLAPLGRRSWLMTRHSARAAVTASLLFLAAILLIVAWPWVFGFGNFIFTGVQQDYMFCTEVTFRRSGLFGGLVGAGVPAVSLWWVMVLSFAAAAAAGFALSWLLATIVAHIGGVPARAKRGAA
jgi:hypothetical protein